MDSLVYAYSGNRLASVNDRSGNNSSPAYMLPGVTSYTYDANGNVKTRVNGTSSGDNITGITYNHLGNVRSAFAGGAPTVPVFGMDYYPFGLQRNANQLPGDPKNNYLYNGKELQDRVKWYDYGARFYDPVIGRWGSVDPLADKYYPLSPFAYVANSPINAIDPDGKRIFWIGGAGNDQIGWNYTDMWQRAVTDGGINGFTRINASHDNAASLRNGGTPWGDIMFTALRRNASYELTPVYNSRDRLGSARGIYSERIPVQDAQIDKAYGDILSNIQNSPLADGEQFNLMGYSYGAVLQAHVALRLANAGYKIDNLVLIGSPISTKSELYKSLTSNKNIGQVLRYDIPGDKLSNPKDILDFIQGGRQNSDPNNTGVGPHYDLARPGDDTYDRIRNVVVEWLRQQGVQ